MSRETIILITLSCLVLQSMIWFVTDPRNRKAKLTDAFEPKRMAFYIQSALFIAIYLVVSLFLTWPASSKDDAWITLGLIIYVAGTFIGIWARFAMNKYWGIPAQHDTKRQTMLITEGPFSYSRNPIYLAILMMFIGFSLALRSFSILLTPVVYFAIYKTVLIEEELLKKHFGKEYEKYIKKVPRFL